MGQLNCHGHRGEVDRGICKERNTQVDDTFLHVKSSASTERFIYLGIARAPSNFRNSERRVPLHAAFDLYVERQRFSCHRCVAALWAFVTHLQSPLRLLHTVLQKFLCNTRVTQKLYRELSLPTIHCAKRISRKKLKMKN